MSTEKDRREAAARVKARHGRENEGQIRHRRILSHVPCIARILGWAIVVWSVIALIAIPLIADEFGLRTAVAMAMQSLFGIVGYALTKLPESPP